MKMFNIRQIISAAAVACGMSLVAAPAKADLILVPDCLDGSCSGSISTSDGGVTAFDGWTTANGGFTISWDISLADSTWTYSYTLSAVGGTTALAKNPSHMLLELSPNFAVEITGPSLEGPKTFGGDPNSPNSDKPGDNNGNPNLPGDLFGIKADIGCPDVGGTLSCTYTFMTVVAPIWGDFYSKNGADAGIVATAWNACFGQEPHPTDGKVNAVGCFIPVPDTDNGITVPEPASLLLYGIGLLGLGVFARRRRRFAA